MKNGARTLFLFGTCLAACSSPQATPQPAPQPSEEAKWDGCEELVEQLGDANTVLSEASYDGTYDAWSFGFSGLDLRVPQREYEVRAGGGADEEVMVMLLSDDLTIVLLASPPEEPIEDVFQTANGPQTDSGKARTAELFGEPPTLHELTVRGYGVTPAAITCAADKEESEAADALAMIISRTASLGELAAVHHDRFGMDELIKLSAFEGEDPTMYSLDIQVPTAKHFHTITVRSTDRALLESLLADELLDSSRVEPGPAWLVALSVASVKDDTASWTAAHDALKKRGAKPETLDSLKKRATDTNEQATLAPDKPLPEISTLKALKAHDGKVGSVTGLYKQVDVRKRTVGDPEYRGHVALVLEDGNRVHLEPTWSKAGIRDDKEIERFDGQTVVATGKLNRSCPLPPEAIAAIISPCLTEISSLRPVE